MMRLLFVLIIFVSFLFAEPDYGVENTNITLYKDKEDIYYNYDRFRFRADMQERDFFATFIGDVVNFYGDDYLSSDEYFAIRESEADTPFNTQTTFKGYDGGEIYAKVYRAYLGYEDERNKLVAGLYNIHMGVGRIWTPTNIYNPKNPYALESAEVFGVATLAYTRYIDDTSHISTFLSQDKNDKYKYGFRYKGFVDFGDVSLNIVLMDKIKTIGYEIEANLFESGIELRSEAIYIKGEFNGDDEEFFQLLLGGDYGFENGLTLAIETLYSSKKFTYETIVSNLDSPFSQNFVFSDFYIGGTISYVINLFLDTSLLYIESFNENNSAFISPSINYTIDDYNSVTLGALLYDGSDTSEFGMFQNRYYLKYIFSF